MMDNYKTNDIKITIGEDKTLYISTLSDLGGDMLKLDFPMGEYGLYPYRQGYYLGVKNYSPKNEDAIQVFNNRDGHKGLMGTYHDGETDNVDRVRIFNHYIGEHMPDDWWEYHSYSEEEFESEDFETIEYKINDSYYHYNRGEVSCLKDYNNIPVFFYLTKQLNLGDLCNIKLECAVVNDCGNIDICWYVIHSTEGRIGIAVKQEEFFNMMGDQAGLCLLSSNGCRAVGNFYNEDLDEDVFCREHIYECEFNPCFCDFEHEYERQRREYREKRLQYLRSIYKIPKVNSSVRSSNK